VHAIFSDEIADASELVAAFRGVSPVRTLALGNYSMVAGNGSTTTIAATNPIDVMAGQGIYAFTWANDVVDLTSPVDLTMVTRVDDGLTGKLEGDWALQRRRALFSRNGRGHSMPRVPCSRR